MGDPRPGDMFKHASGDGFVLAIVSESALILWPSDGFTRTWMEMSFVRAGKRIENPEAYCSAHASRADEQAREAVFAAGARAALRHAEAAGQWALLGKLVSALHTMSALPDAST